ncbi:DELTA-stichotoxin-Hcr4a-like [Cyprinus carpio]|uniref:DELTA-stichotoxin-Hcr4a-like n=1 Tax=Cyprinus carpio TaxID=7962 RepID=A0A8C1L454_CYPCA|nr:DELTA-stichotoxin-Hcr4a-like [Cyprinus carpio]XP_042576234.1 DELTA-stichotoxin-Hcr4a-like [Cyprinus carpio]
MTESAEAAAANVSSKRHATIEITNLTNNYCLLNPKAYLESGETFNPPQPTVRPLKTEVCTFSKTSAKATGSVGVMTYDLFERSRNDYTQTLAVMFSVPWDYNLYKNWFAVGIYPKGKECDQALYKEMYYQNNPQSFVREEANGSGINFEGKSLDIRATMCPLGSAIIKLEVWDKLLSPLSQQVC